MNEQELSALIDELIREQKVKHPERYQAAETQELPQPPQPAEIPEPAVLHIPEPEPEIAEEPAPVRVPQTPDMPGEDQALRETDADNAQDHQDGFAEADAEEMQQPDTRRSRIHDALDVQPEPDAQPLPKPKTRTRDVIVGVLLVLLAAYGVCALVLRGIAYADRLRADDNTQHEAVAACILPLVVIDMPEFEDPGALSDDQFLTAAIWAAVTSGKLSDYPESFDMHTVPAADLIAEGNRLFAVNRSPACHTIGFSGDLRFYYDAETDSYLLPANPELFTYVPVIREMTETETGQYLVTADYQAEQPSWKTDAPKTVKTMQFTVQESANGCGGVIGGHCGDAVPTPLPEGRRSLRTSLYKKSPVPVRGRGIFI